MLSVQNLGLLAVLAALLILFLTSSTGLGLAVLVVGAIVAVVGIITGK
jgi:hypothetical protein